MVQPNNAPDLDPEIFIARFDRVDRNVLAIETILRRSYWNGRQVQEVTASKLQKQIFLNLFLVAIVFGFALISCLCDPTLMHLAISIGLCGCMYTGMLINQFATLLLHGMND